MNFQCGFVLFVLFVFILQPTYSAEVKKEVKGDSFTEEIIRSIEVFENFIDKFWDPTFGYLLRYYPNTNNDFSEYWNFAESYETLINAIILTNNLNETKLNQRYWEYSSLFFNGQQNQGWFSAYYDDMNWMTMSLMRAYFLSEKNNNLDLFFSSQSSIDKPFFDKLIFGYYNDANLRMKKEYEQSDDYLSVAMMLFSEIMNAWDTTCCGDLKGGIWWDMNHTQKATASNAGPVISSVYLYIATKNATYLEFAEKVYSFWYENMVNSSTFQVADHFDDNGNVVWWKYTYNEGLMIGASVSLYVITKNSTYLQNAESIAQFMITSETIETSFGPVLNDGSSSQCTGTDCPQFKGIAYSALHSLYLFSPSNQYFEVLNASATSIWENAKTNLMFGTAWQGPPPPLPSSSSQLNNAQESSAITALLVYSRLLNSLNSF